MRIRKPIHHDLGSRVQWDDATGVVIAALESGRNVSDDYLVSWDAGGTSVVWGSDLVAVNPTHHYRPIGCQPSDCCGDPEAHNER